MLSLVSYFGGRRSATTPAPVVDIPAGNGAEAMSGRQPLQLCVSARDRCIITALLAPYLF